MIGIMRSLTVAGVIVAISVIAFWWWRADLAQRTIDELQALTTRQEELLAQRQAMLDRLSRSRRIAHVEVVNQTETPAGEIAETSIRFIELDDLGGELDRQMFTIPGDVLFIDAWTVKFDPERVAAGDPLRGRTLILLRRIYSERLAPEDGLAIDTPGAVPPGYAASEMAAFERRLWEHFWRIATNAALASEMGVRVAQGEAVYKPVKTGEAYELIVDAAGGMNLTPLPAGARPRPQPETREPAHADASPSRPRR